MDGFSAGQGEQFADALAEFGPALARLARGYEAEAAERRDLLQNIHLAIWRSLSVHDGKCSMRTWVFRVAHNVGASHVLRRKRRNRFEPATLEELEAARAADDPERNAGDRHLLARLLHLIRALKPPDAEVMLLYLEDFSAAEIGEVTGLSAGAVATRISRAKTLLARTLGEATRHGE